MGLNFRRSIKAGPARINLSKSGVGCSFGLGGLRYTKSAKRKKSDSSGGCIGVLFKWLAYLGLFLLALYVVGNYWPWIVGAAALIAAIVIGIQIYRSKTQMKENAFEEDNEQNDPVP